MDFKSILSVTLILFSVIDIIGNIPIILSLKEKGKKIHSGQASIIACILMIAFLFLGESILGLFGVDIQSFALAGALIILLIGMEMVLGIELFKDDVSSSNYTVVPLAFPLIAGAGTMTTIISLQVEYDIIEIVIGILINSIIVFSVLKSSTWLGKKLGKGGLNILRKVFGIILIAIAMKIVKGNISFIVG